MPEGHEEISFTVRLLPHLLRRRRCMRTSILAGALLGGVIATGPVSHALGTTRLRPQKSGPLPTAAGGQ
jgi:hypothetical protein